MVYLDTHVVVWLYTGDHVRIPRLAREQLSAEDVRISPMVVLELALLHEIGRLAGPPDVALAYLADKIGLSICELPFSSVVRAAAGLAWTRDPIDRLIVAHAAVRGSTLITIDQRIRASYPHAMWD